MIKNFLIKALVSFIKLLGMSDFKQQQFEAKILSAKVCINQMKMMPPVKKLSDSEFKVFSQFGDDGILQYLIYHLNIPSRLQTFVEFGVENYEESNTRFLLMNDNWRGFIIDGDEKNMQFVRGSHYFWKYDLATKAAFIDAHNINDLILEAGFSGEIGILSVDIDGNDYWVWDKICVVNPVIIVAEYNGIFGSQYPLTVPYNSTFRRTQAHYSNLYWGCSLAALNHLSIKKGYTFAGCNSAGNNAYFVRSDYFNDSIPKPSLTDGFVDPKFKESRGVNGSLTFLTGASRLKEIRDLPLVNVVSGETYLISQLYSGVIND
jgi:hypothetical protein